MLAPKVHSLAHHRHFVSCTCSRRDAFPPCAHAAPGALLRSGACLCRWASLRRLFPTQTRAGRSSGLLGSTCSTGPGRGRGVEATAGMFQECLLQLRPAGSCCSLRRAVRSPGRTGRRSGVPVKPSCAGSQEAERHNLSLFLAC